MTFLWVSIKNPTASTYKPSPLFTICCKPSSLMCRRSSKPIHAHNSVHRHPWRLLPAKSMAMSLCVALCLAIVVENQMNIRLCWYLCLNLIEQLAELQRTMPAMKLTDDLASKLAEFGLKWDAKFPTITKSWRGNGARVIPFFATRRKFAE